MSPVTRQHEIIKLCCAWKIIIKVLSSSRCWPYCCLQPPVPKRPIHMIAQDVKLLCPAELRDTLMLLFHHMQKAFTGISFGQPRGPVRINTKKQQQQQQAGTSGESAGTGRSMFDSLDIGGSLGRSSAPVGSKAAGPSAGGRLTRRASTDTAFAASSADVGSAASAGGAAGAPAASGASSSSMVSTPFEEEKMLQKILQENQAAAASKAMELLDKRTRSAGDLSACSTGSRGAGTTAADVTVSTAAEGDSSTHMPQAAAGSGHANAVTGAAGPDSPLLSVSTAAEGLQSESAGKAHAEASSPVRGQPGAAGSLEEVLLEYEIQFVQVQVGTTSTLVRSRSLSSADLLVYYKVLSCVTFDIGYASSNGSSSSGGGSSGGSGSCGSHFSS